MPAIVYSTAAPKFPPNARCDSCSARPRVLVTMQGFTTLSFCYHHYREHKQALLRDALAIEHPRDLALEPEVTAR